LGEGVVKLELGGVVDATKGLYQDKNHFGLAGKGVSIIPIAPGNPPFPGGVAEGALLYAL
jgi:hypothetical protein